MEKVNLLGRIAEVLGENVKFHSEEETEKSYNSSCSGNACADIDYQFDDDTKSYHFFNDGSKKVLLKVRKATYLGCTAISKTRRLRPGEEWDSGFFGFCDYIANYR